jgi:Flp pilus assembly protein TadB
MSEASNSVRAHPIALLLAAIGVGLVVYLAIALSDPLVWIAVAVIAAVATFLYVRGRRIEAARERAWEGSFSLSFADARRRAEATAVTDTD